jgi:four helix bundle protein
MEKIRRFTDLEVWRKSHSLFIDLYSAVCALLPEPKSRPLANQIIRSCGSIGANISEGHLASSAKEYIRYLSIAKRTSAETENWLYKLRDVGLMDRERCAGFVKRCVEIQKMLTGLAKSLRRYDNG